MNTYESRFGLNEEVNVLLRDRDNIVRIHQLKVIKVHFSPNNVMYDLQCNSESIGAEPDFKHIRLYNVPQSQLEKIR